MTSICDTTSNSSRVILDSNSDLRFDLDEISDDVVEEAGDVLAAVMSDCTWILSACNSLSISGSRVGIDTVRKIVGELTVEG